MSNHISRDFDPQHKLVLFLNRGCRGCVAFALTTSLFYYTRVVMDENTGEVMEDTSQMTFRSLPKVCERTKKALDEMGFTTMMDVQAKAINASLNQRDVIVRAKTGSGKTLAFLIPAVEMLYYFKFRNYMGTGVIILSPTRELATQTYGVAKKLMKYHSQVPVLLVGGGDLKKEIKKIGNGASLIVATPGRLLHHLEERDYFFYKFCVFLVIDEADRILDIGFEEEMKKILKYLPKMKQSGFYSATYSSRSLAIANAAVRKSATVHIGFELKEIATVEGLEQAFLLIPTEKRFLALYTFLRRNGRGMKIVVFFSSCLSVKFHSELLNYVRIPCFNIHGKLKRNIRNRAYRQFCKAEKGILLCTDIAARGMDMPNVDWVIQYDPPDDPKEYIHRVGRTARGKDGKGKAAIFLRPEEKMFVKYLLLSHIPLKLYEYPWREVHPDYEPRYFELVNGNYHFKHAARLAYKAYILSYRSHRLKDIFDETKLDLQAVARTFGLRRPPPGVFK